MNKETLKKVTQWFKDGDKQMRKELRIYVFSLDMPYGKKCKIWEHIVRKTLLRNDWRPKEKQKTIVI
jgi:hypothetical protein